jgi:hypothetical protein
MAALASTPLVVIVLQLLLLGCNTASGFQRQATTMSLPLRTSVRRAAASATAASATVTDGASSSSSSSSSSLDRLLAPLPPEQLVEYLRKGHMAVRGLFSQEEVLELKPKVLAAFEAEELEALRHEVRYLKRSASWILIVLYS